MLAILLQGERQFCGGLVSSHRRRIAQKAEIIERRRTEREEAERKERERRAELERKRVERLLGEAEAFRRAAAIRDYVAGAQRAYAASACPKPEAEVEAWARWALAEANRIDPVRSGAFLKERE